MELRTVLGQVARLRDEVDRLTAENATLDASLAQHIADVAELTAENARLRQRCIDYANAEPPTGWIEPGEDGYENTPDGARAQRDQAVAENARLRTEAKLTEGTVITPLRNEVWQLRAQLAAVTERGTRCTWCGRDPAIDGHGKQP